MAYLSYSQQTWSAEFHVTYVPAKQGNEQLIYPIIICILLIHFVKKLGRPQLSYSSTSRKLASCGYDRKQCLDPKSELVSFMEIVGILELLIDLALP
jgi:hypothetical protein